MRWPILELGHVRAQDESLPAHLPPLPHFIALLMLSYLRRYLSCLIYFEASLQHVNLFIFSQKPLLFQFNTFFF